ncbi:hypothetical protein QJS04_geneDACA007517 [Acorus gramineus]|uniref:TRUD domain-containing protein n=1 Tax=Acorus gramineus TaxID=55184 RepID=A0AAV9B6T9_ACOGR|nr:hypothetical protein QJS04_geneDACA007517 [Acorus gramineus]
MTTAAFNAKTLDETDVGISCFVSDTPGFRGVLKQRYSDFIVNEVDREGNIVHLTCLDPPLEKSQDGLRKEEANDLNVTEKDYSSLVESFQTLAGVADAESLKGLLDQIESAGAENVVRPIVLSADPDKSHRTEVHNFFKKNFKFLITDTVEVPGSDLKCVRVRYSSSGEKGRGGRKRKDRGESNKPFDSRGSDDWPDHLGKFLLFTLYKENKDTQEALGLIGKMLGIQQRSFGFAGTKDKRSISTQRVTVFKQHAERLAALNKRLIGIKVGDFCYVREGLVLGQLLGNHFTITLRGVVAESDDIIKAAADGLGKGGFINYYGLQRFGSGSVPTHLIGAALLRGEWKLAVGLILDPREGERAAIQEAREYYKEVRNIDVTLRKLPRHLVAERAILQCLKKCPGNYLQALKGIPRTLRMMYVHSYQSYLWNHAASMRVQKHGVTKVVLGDLVYCKGSSQETIAEVMNDEPGVDSIDTCDDSGLPEFSEASTPEERIVKVISAEDLAAGIYTVDDVVLPLPGSRVIYPTNDIADVYHDLARQDGINLTESVHGSKEFSITSMTGGYRRVFQRPMDYEWELLTYTDCNVSLALSDMDVIAKASLTDSIKENDLSIENNDSSTFNSMEQSETSVNTGENSSNNENGADGPVNPQYPQLALKLGFTLPSSCYATMAIRELLKSSTSVAFQKTLNQVSQNTTPNVSLNG